MPKEHVGMRTAVDSDAVERYTGEYNNSGDGALRERLDGVENHLDQIFEAAGPQFDVTSDALASVEGMAGSVPERCTKIVDLHSELSALESVMAERARVETVRNEIAEYRESNVRDAVDSGVLSTSRAVNMADRAFASVRERFGDGAQAPSLMQAMRRSGNLLMLELDHDVGEYLATVVKTDAGWDPFVTRQPGAIPAISRPLQIYDVFPMSTTTEHSIKYMMQTTRTATAIVEKAEGVASGEAALAWTERTEAMKEIPAHIPVTEIQLEDAPQTRGLINRDLALMVMQRLDGQLLFGDGTAPNINGVLQTRNTQAVTQYTWSQASNKRNDQITDMKKAKTKVRWAAYCMPNVYIIHPTIWDEISLSETSAAGYYLGSPANQFVERLWGLPVVESDHLTDANDGSDGSADDHVGAIVMDTMWTMHWVRRGVHIEVGYNDTDFIQRQLTIRAGMRCCLQVTRPQAIGKLTMSA